MSRQLEFLDILNAVLVNFGGREQVFELTMVCVLGIASCLDVFLACLVDRWQSYAVDLPDLPLRLFLVSILIHHLQFIRRQAFVEAQGLERLLVVSREVACGGRLSLLGPASLWHRFGHILLVFLHDLRRRHFCEVGGRLPKWRH